MDITLRCLFGLLAVTAVAPAYAADAALVEVARVQIAHSAEELPISGTVSSPRESRLSATVAGSVTTILVDAGSRVARGEPLLRLDSTLARLDLERSAAQAAEAEARLAESRRQLRESRRLLDQKHIALSVYEAAEANVHVAEAVSLQSQAAAKRQEEILQRHTIDAPFTGVVSKRRVSAGEWVDTGDELLTLVELGSLRVDLQVPQLYFPRLRTGLPVSVSFDALPASSREATIDVIVPVSSPTARTFLVRIELDNSDGSLTPGMSARARIQLPADNGETVLKVPRDAVVRTRTESPYVMCVRNEDSMLVARKVPVTVAAANAAMLVVDSSELAAGDYVIVSGNEIVRDGEAVKIVNNETVELSGN